MFDSVQFLFKEFQFKVGSFSLPVTYWEAIAIVVLLFLLVITMAQFRRHYVDWSLKGGIAGVFFGFLLALILEGFLLIGGKTVLTESLGWKNAPKPISRVLEAGKNQLIQVLGAQTQIPTSFAKGENTVQDNIKAIQSLSPSDLKKVKNILCAP